MTVTYFGHPAAGPLDFSEVVPLWQGGSGGGARRMPFAAFREMPFFPTGVTAAGSDQGSATPLDPNYDVFEVLTVPPGSGVRLAALVSYRNAQFKIIRCNGLPNTNVLRVYPAAGGKLNDQADNGWLNVDPGMALLLYCTQALRWKSIP